MYVIQRYASGVTIRETKIANSGGKVGNELAYTHNTDTYRNRAEEE